MGVQGEKSCLGGSSQGKVAMGLASKGAITRVPHQLLSAKLQGGIKIVGGIETRLLKILENCQNIAIYVAMLPWFFLFVYFVIPPPVYIYVTEMENWRKQIKSLLLMDKPLIRQLHINRLSAFCRKQKIMSSLLWLEELFLSSSVL